MAKIPRPPLAEMIAKTPAAQSRSEAMAHIERRRKSILAEAIENQPTSEADPDSFSEAPYPDPPKLEDVIKGYRPQPGKRAILPKADRDPSSRDNTTRSQRPTKSKLSIVKSDDEPLV